MKNAVWGAVIRRIGCTNLLFEFSSYFNLLFFVLYALFKLAGWPRRPPIARGSQWVPKDLAALSLSLSMHTQVTHSFLRVSCSVLQAGP